MRIQNPDELGKAVRALRRAQGITQGQLAMTAGTNRRFVIDLERGKPTSHIGKALDVLATLGASIEVVPPVATQAPAPVRKRAKRTS